jgi:hypothetical protein
MKHAHSSYVRMVLPMSLTHWVKFEPKFYIQILRLCIVSSLRTEPTNPQGNSMPTLKVHSHLVLVTQVSHFPYKKWGQISIVYIVIVTLNIALNQSVTM